MVTFAMSIFLLTIIPESLVDSPLLNSLTSVMLPLPWITWNVMSWMVERSALSLLRIAARVLMK